jgi:hypothetical protein
VAAAATACSRLSYSAKGREILFSDDLIDALVKTLSNSGAGPAWG